MRSVPDLPVAPSAVRSALDQDPRLHVGRHLPGVHQGVRGAVSGIPGGPRGYQVIVAAIQHQADSQGALAQRLGVDRTVMTYLIDDLDETSSALNDRSASPKASVRPRSSRPRRAVS